MFGIEKDARTIGAFPPLASVPRPQLEGGYKYRGRCEPVLPQPSPSSLLAAAGMRSAPGKAARTMKT